MGIVRLSKDDKDLYRKFFREYHVDDLYPHPYVHYKGDWYHHIVNKWGRGNQDKMDPEDSIYSVSDYRYFNGVPIICYTIPTGYLTYIKSPTIFVEVHRLMDKITRMYGRILMKDILRYGRKWFHKHLANIVSPEHIENSLHFGRYIAESTEDINFKVEGI